MPPAKRTTKKAPAKKTVTKKTVTKKRTMSPQHKKALAEGRRMSSAIDAYLKALHVPKPRGRQVSVETTRKRLAEAQSRAKAATGLDRVLAAQEVRDLQARLATRGSGGNQNVKVVEQAFVRVAKRFSESRGITYGAWRDAGVPAPVLKRAGIPRTRG